MKPSRDNVPSSSQSSSQDVKSVITRTVQEGNDFQLSFKEKNLTTHWPKGAASVSRSLVLTDLKSEPL